TIDDDTIDDDTIDDDTIDDDTADDDTMEPTVESITPDSGHNFYAVPVTIAGTQFTDHIDKLYLDDFELTNVQIVSETVITAAAPSGIAGGLHDLKIRQGPRTFSFTALYTAVDDYAAYAMIDGFVYDPDGVPLSDLGIYRSGGLFSTTTLTNGFFVLPVLPGTGNLMMSNNGPANDAAPMETIKLLDAHAFADDESFDFDLEYFTLSGTVNSADDGPVDNVGVQVFPYEDFTQVGSVRTDVNGDYSMPLYANTYSVSAVASDNPELAPLYTEQYAFTGDQTLPLTLNGGYVLSGQITDRDGSPMPNISISPHLLANHMIAQAGATTDADGNYAVHLQPGEYIIMLSDFSGAYPQLPREGVYFVGSTIVAGDTTFDHQFDYEIIDVTVTLGGETVDFDVEVVPEGDMGPMSSTTIEAGTGTLSLRPGAYYIHLVPPHDMGAALTSHSDVVIGGSDLMTFALDAAVVLDGVMQDQDGNPLSYMRVCADPTASLGSSCYDRQRCRQIESGGAYSLDLAPGEYNLKVNKYWDLLARQVAGRYLTVPNLGVYADMTYNVIVDLYELSGTAYRGETIATGWRVRITSGQGHNLDTILNPAGQFAVKMPAGFYDIMFYPPSPSTPRPIVARNMQIDESAAIVAHVPTE
ncbi:MAG TPA: carboxypeptidase-like regulatory domain-containing protein, partial [bacterium]|nr:carboxypeptidase-like regulatory domain-containing protein [bacterium]